MTITYEDPVPYMLGGRGKRGKGKQEGEGKGELKRGIKRA
jgi:hypothetical protein